MLSKTFAQNYSLPLFLTVFLLALSHIRGAERRSKLMCENQSRDCETILRDTLSLIDRFPSSCEIDRNNIFSNHEINPTTYLQPSVNLTDFNPDLPDRSYLKGLIVGYRDCNNTQTSATCYVVIDELPNRSLHFTDKFWFVAPEDEDVDKNRQLSSGDTCTFFGCYIRDSDNDKICYKQNFFEENVTIIGSCSEYRESVENGSVTVQFLPEYHDQYIEGTVVNVSCDEGFWASYNGTSICQRNGNWSTPEFPTCTRQCPWFEVDIENGVVVMSNSIPIVNTTITLTCLPYYNGSGTITCDENGNWSSSLPPCVPILCPWFESSVYGGRTVDNRPIGAPTDVDGYPLNTTLTVSCDLFHQGGGQITCIDNNTWSHPNLPICPLNLLSVLVFIAIILFFVLATMLCLLLCKKYQEYRNNAVRRLNLLFSMQAIREDLDPDYTPVSVWPNKKFSLAEDHYEPLLSISNLTSVTNSTRDSVPILTKAYSADNIYKELTFLPLDKCRSCPLLLEGGERPRRTGTQGAQLAASDSRPLQNNSEIQTEADQPHPQTDYIPSHEITQDVGDIRLSSFASLFTQSGLAPSSGDKSYEKTKYASVGLLTPHPEYVSCDTNGRLKEPVNRWNSNYVEENSVPATISFSLTQVVIGQRLTHSNTGSLLFTDKDHSSSCGSSYVNEEAALTDLGPKNINCHSYANTGQPNQFRKVPAGYVTLANTSSQM